MAIATTYTLTGPASGRAGESLVFTASIGADTHAGVTITPAASVAASGTFAPTTVTLSTETPTATFTFTPSKLAAVNNISTTSSPSLTNPAAVALAVVADLTLTGPAALPPGVSTAYEVEIGPGTITGNVVVTPAGPAGWTFTPATVTLTQAARKKSFAVKADEPESGTLTITADVTYALPGTGLALVSQYNTTSLETTFRNPTADAVHYPFLGLRGTTIPAGGSASFLGGPEAALSRNGFPNQRDFDDFSRAIKAGTLEILATPAVIVTDASTQATKVLTLVNGTIGTGDPSYGAYSDL